MAAPTSVLWVPRTSSSVRDQAIFVDQATDASLPSDAVPTARRNRHHLDSHAGKHRVERGREPYRCQVFRVGVRLVTRQI